MVQGNEANLESFQEAFPLLKAEVDTKRINVPSDVPSDSEGDKSPIENPNTLSISAPPTPASSNNRLKESMALLELDFAEFKERTQARQSGPPDNTLQQLKEDLQQLKSDNEALASDLRGSVKRPYRASQTASSPSPPQDHQPCCEETQQLSLDLPLPTPPTHPEEATLTQLNTCTTSAAEICSNSCSSSPSPPTAAELCCSCSPACCHPPSPCYL
ncbi:hypothetical protein JOQ06_014943 [Pogonophryne albipinna]|uniref:Uncharacterized protein n=1 Tax=Pogonophryne albipinna TaxID=1090488 RepID=A0AAD6FB94_9TELE|nr:hypothetical protein JOQ06_014943 [Pogonophryne albipinna]